MSFDLMVFDPALVKYQEREEFIEWFEQTTEWEGDFDYDDPAHASKPLRAWFAEITLEFPPMNGPLSPSLEKSDEFNMADYAISPDAIYVSFSWSDAVAGSKNTIDLAEKHGLGFFDLSGADGAVWVPDDVGKLVRVH